MDKQIYSAEYTEDELPQIVNDIYNYGKNENIWLFYGGMGAGKTTFIKQLASYLKVEDSVSSPTFSIVNEYKSEDNDTIYHFDFYRIENEFEALDIGVEDYFYDGNLCLIEWPEKIPDLIPEKYLMLRISTSDYTKKRMITVERHG